MTNRDAVKGIIGFVVPSGALDARAEFAEIDLDATYVKEDKRKIVIFSASLLLFIAQSPKSLSELDWSVTNRSVADLLLIRKAILFENGIKDKFNVPTINSKKLW